MTKLPRRLITFFYDLCLVLAFFIALPRLIYAMLVHGKYKKSLPERFGLRKPRAPSGNGPLAWFHGASVGEVSLLLPVLERFRKEFPQWRCIVTACSEAGVATAERLFTPLNVSSFVLPFDHSFIMKPLVRFFSPSLVIFSEGDCWMNFVQEAKNIGAKTVVINGKLSENSSKIFLSLKALSRSYFSSIDHFFLQDERYQKHFLQLGIPKEKLCVTGNIKTYVETTDNSLERIQWRNSLQVALDDKILVLGSMHLPDVQAWIPSLRRLIPLGIKILLVPRRMEIVKKCAEICSQERWSFRLWSQQQTFKDCEILIVDMIGILKSLYKSGDLAFVGGTFDSTIGGHNLLEPLQAGTPVIFGPHIQSQSDLAVRLVLDEAGLCIKDPNHIFAAVQQILMNREAWERAAQKGHIFLEKEKEAFLRTWHELKAIIV